MGYTDIDHTTGSFVIDNHNDLLNRDLAGNHAKLVPLADGATAIQITKADGTTALFNIDTLNGIVSFFAALQFKDSNSSTVIQTPVDITTDEIVIGDFDAVGNGTYIGVNDATKTITTLADRQVKATNSANTYNDVMSISLNDSDELEPAGSYFDLVTAKSGLAILKLGDEFAIFHFLSDGTIEFINVSDNVFQSLQIGTNHVIIKDNGTNVRIVNELGASAQMTLNVWYN